MRPISGIIPGMSISERARRIRFRGTLAPEPSPTWRHRAALFVVAVLLVLLAGCASKTEPATAFPMLTSTPTATATQTTTPTLTLTSTQTPTYTPTPSPTLTPTPTPTSTSTPTAMPLTVIQTELPAVSAPPAQPGAPCGVVDLLDFPLNPPDAEGASGGQDFGQYRSRVGKYHAGEDWYAARRSQSLGMTVYSIGHGTVTYAAPLGWGQDKGVVIVRHISADGKTFLSFYGHLDPDSVVLEAGTCVARGDVVGKIGKPRGSPHLHFEIRTHMPDQPGPGYWSLDPTSVGWKPPSQTIWKSRVAVAPGVQWTLPAAKEGVEGVGLLADGSFVILEDDKLVGIDIVDGRVRWKQTGTARVYQAVVDATRSLIYTTSTLGVVEAFSLSSAQNGGAFAWPTEPLWRIELDVGVFPSLYPLPGASVAVSGQNRIVGLSQDGDVLWDRSLSVWIVDWSLVNDQLILSGIGGNETLWTGDAKGINGWDSAPGGLLTVSGNDLFVFDGEGIHRLDPKARSVELVHPLPNGLFGYGDLLAMPDGSLLVIHKDTLNISLVVLNPDGSLRWQRSLSNLGRVQNRLLALGDSAYLVSERRTTASSELFVFAIDLAHAELTQIFRGGSRSPASAALWTFAVDQDMVLIGIEGTGTVALDVRQAVVEALAKKSSSP